MVSRRNFARQLISAAAALTCGRFSMPGGTFGPTRRPGLVVKACSEKLKRRQHDMDIPSATYFLNQSLMKLTGLPDPAKAWRSLFFADEKIGLKLSCLPGRSLSSSPGLLAAVISGLTSAGIPADNIILFERTRRELEAAGFRDSFHGARIQGTDQLPDGGYSETISLSGTVGTCFSRILQQVDALISLPVLKDHDISGVSAGMKNWYGAMHNPNKYHQNRCDPYLADLCNHPLIRDKWRLTIADASRVQVHNGPAFHASYASEYGAILLGTDPVAVDYYGWQLIDSLRKKMGLKTLEEENRSPTYIQSAARLKLGLAGKGRVRLVEISG